VNAFSGDQAVVNGGSISENLRAHLRALTVEIGERSIYRPDNLLRAAKYIASFSRDQGLDPAVDFYDFRNIPVTNVVSRIDFGPNPSRSFVVGAHYDSLRGTVGADDNASSVAVQLETMRELKKLQGKVDLDLSVIFVSFTLEEPPGFRSPGRGSKVYAGKAKRRKQNIDGAICLEMVGFRSCGPNSQRYPFPLNLADYPKEGDFVAIVGNTGSRQFMRALRDSFVSNPGLPAIALSVPFNGWILPSVRRSDHVSFWDLGYKAVMITDTAFFRNPNYHRKSDTMETLDFEFMAELVKSVVTFFASRKGE
jgi:Zn-dependent M28 family amino/carboxypeptidase